MPPTYAQNLGAQIQFDQGIGYSIPVPGNGLPSLVQPPQTPTQPISQPATQPAPQPPAQQQGQQAQPVQLNSIFSPHIGTRASQVNPTQLEYFNKQTGQGFSTEQQALTFASGLGAGQVTSLDQLQAPVNSQQSTNGQQIPSSDPNKQLAGVAGNAGLSVDDFLKLAQANSALTPEDIAAIRKSLGIDQASAAAFAPPAQSTVDLYNQAYGSAGLGDIKNQVKALSSQIAQQQNDYADAVASINENPFLDEASRVGRQNTLATQAQQKISNLQQEQSNLNDLYTQGLTQVNAFVTNNTNDFNTQRQQAVAKLDYLNQQAQSIGQAELAQKQQAVYRYLPDYLTSKQQATEPFGSAQYGYFKYNPNTQSFDQVSGPAAQFQSNPTTGDLFNTANGQTAGSTGSPSAYGAPPPQTGPSANLPQRNNNPGDLTNPSTGQFMVYTTPQQGWQALVNDIQAKISGNNAHGLGANSTLQDFANVYDPKSATNGNDPGAYAANLAKQLGVTPTTKLGDLSSRVQDFATAIANNEGYFAGSTAQGTPGAALIAQAAQALVDETAAPSQYSKRGATYQTILNQANQLSLKQKGVPFDAQQAETNFSNKEAVRPILNNEASAESHLDTVLQKSAAFSRSDSPIVNEGLIVTGSKLTGNAAVNDYLSAVKDAQGEIAKVLAGSGAPTDADKASAAQLLNPNLGPASLASQIQTIKTLLKQKVAAYTDNTVGSSNHALVNISDINFSY